MATDSKAWHMVTILVPVVLTGWLTFGQQRIREQIDAKQQMLSAQLSLTTELFKRRFDSYEALYSQLISLHRKLDKQDAIASGMTSTTDKYLAASKQQTTDLLIALNKSQAANALHMSKQVAALMDAAIWAGVHGETDKLSKKITEVEDQMKDELEAEMERRTPPAH